MAVTSADISLRYSTVEATAGAQLYGNLIPGQSLGGFVSITTLASGTAATLFPNITPDDAAALATDYQCVFVVNTNENDSLAEVSVWATAASPTGTSVELGADPIGVTPLASTTVQALVLTNRYEVPDGVTFAPAASSEDALLLGDLAPLQVVAFWVSRTALGSDVAVPADALTFHVTGMPAVLTFPDAALYPSEELFPGVAS